MKNTVCLALIILAVLPAAAQKAASVNCSANGSSVAALGRAYAARVDGLLRDVHANLLKISERMEAGELTPERERELKLAATRAMIARLDTISAVYDTRLDSMSFNSKNKGCTGPESGASNASAPSSAENAATHTNNSVSVEELKREATAALAAPLPQGSGLCYLRVSVTNPASQ